MFATDGSHSLVSRLAQTETGSVGVKIFIGAQAAFPDSFVGATSRFGKSARRTGNIYVAPMELVPAKAENADRS